MLGLPLSVGEYFGLPPSDYVLSRALAASTQEQFVIPTGAKFVMFAANDHFAAKFGTSAVAAAWPTDVTDGTASELNPTLRTIPRDATHISVIGLTAMVVTASFYGAG